MIIGFNTGPACVTLDTSHHKCGTVTLSKIGQKHPPWAITSQPKRGVKLAYIYFYKCIKINSFQSYSVNVSHFPPKMNWPIFFLHKLIVKVLHFWCQ